MKKRFGLQDFFLDVTLKSLLAVFVIIGLMILFARSFGELAIPALNMMASIIWIPVLTFLIGVSGFFLSRR